MYEVATFTCAAATAVVSVSAAKFVIARAIPVPKRMPNAPPCRLTDPEAGTVMVKTGTSVPTVGAVALL